MISLLEFDEATAYERWALAGLVLLPTARRHSAVKDIENNAVRVTLCKPTQLIGPPQQFLGQHRLEQRRLIAYGTNSGPRPLLA